MTWSLAGNQPLTEALTNGLREESLPHACLLVGPVGVGKRALALELAAALNCRAAERPCRVCSACRRILGGKHPDVHMVEGLREERGGEARLHREIRIDQIREVQRHAALKPFEGRRRVFIVDGADRMNVEASNCLLKTLEEPPEGVILLLLAAREDLVLPTVQSRCQRMEVKPLPALSIARMLRESTELPDEQIELLARLSSGRIGWATRAAQDPSLLAQRTERLQELEELIDGGIARRLAVAAGADRQFARDRQGALDLLDLWAGWWRDLLLTRAGCPELVDNLDRAAGLAQVAEAMELEQASGFLRRLERAAAQIEQNINLRLTLEALVLEMPAARSELRPVTVTKGES